MDEPDQRFRAGIDRMDHPLSHTAAVVAGIAFIFLVGSLALLLSDRDMLQSTTWWRVFVLSSSAMSVSVIGYFRPHSRVIYVPVLLAGLVLLGLCVWHFWWVRHPMTRIHPAKGLYQSLGFFAAWLAWAGRTLWHLRRARQTP